jgi:prepilin-type N-terminal cleavage/methylation domain-containing protein
MHSLKKRQQGFTIVELLIVIVVIGILAALVITTYAGIQAKARNSKRQTDVQNIQTQLEAYFQTAGNYPSLADMNNATWLAANMKSLDTGALTDPQGASSALVATAAAKVYAYAPLNATNASCEASDITCTQYTLTATLENNAGTYVKKNLD